MARRAAFPLARLYLRRRNAVTKNALGEARDVGRSDAKRMVFASVWRKGWVSVWVSDWFSAKPVQRQAFKKARKHWGKLEAGVGIEATIKYTPACTKQVLTHK